MERRKSKIPVRRAHSKSEASPAERQRPHFGSDRDVAALTGFSVKTLRKDRLLNRKRFPWYKAGGKVLYDLDEVEAIIRRTAKGEAIA